MRHSTLCPLGNIRTDNVGTGAGPGGSGNALVYGAGPGLSVITERKLDIVGFDPRGINMTTPRVCNFFPCLNDITR